MKTISAIILILALIFLAYILFKGEEQPTEPTFTIEEEQTPTPSPAIDSPNFKNTDKWY